MTTNSREYGKKAEEIAAEYLEKCGYKIIEKNFYTKSGEIDIIAKDKETIAFIEVKARKSLTYGPPEQSITYTKKKKISQSAMFYLKKTKQMNKKARFDVLSIIADNEIKFKLIKNAFEAAYK